MKNTPISNPVKRLVTVLSVILYAAGLVLMFFNIPAGLSLWLISTVLGLGFLFLYRRRQELAEQEKEKLDEG